MRCESYITLTVLVIVCLIKETAAEPRWGWGGSRQRRRCPKTNCVPGSWAPWSACSHSCGPSGTQYTRRPIIKPQKCGGTCLVTTTAARACNRFCVNGGTLIRSRCHCKAGYSGVCCERGEFLNDLLWFSRTGMERQRQCFMVDNSYCRSVKASRSVLFQ